MINETEILKDAKHRNYLFHGFIYKIILCKKENLNFHSLNLNFEV